MAAPFAAALPTTLDALRYEPRPQRIRVHLDGVPVADTTEAFLVWEPRRVVPLYAVPWRDFTAGLERASHVEPDLASAPPVLQPGRFAVHTTPGHEVDLKVGEKTLSGVAFVPDDPDLGDRVILDFSAFDWLEEESAVIGHPHDPFKRIDVLSSSRRIQVAVEGVELADSTRAKMLLETHLPVRWYLPRADVRLDLLTPSETDTICAYKGHASYWSYEPAGDDGRDLCWTYLEPLHDAEPVQDMVCFFVERTDTYVDGELVPRPRTYWSKPD